MGEEGRELQKPEQTEIVEGEFEESPPPPPIVERGGIPQAPLHSLSSLVTVALDSLWSVPEFASMASIAGLPALPILAIGAGVTCATAVALVQRYVSKEEWGASIAKGVAMGVVAGVPFPFTGTTAGSILLLWAGAHAFFGRKQLPPG
jgi:hypothetical protein